MIPQCVQLGLNLSLNNNLRNTHLLVFNRKTIFAERSTQNRRTCNKRSSLKQIVVQIENLTEVDVDTDTIRCRYD